MFQKKINLTLTAVLAIMLFFFIPFYQAWFNKSILADDAVFSEQIKHLEPEYRRFVRYGGPVAMYDQLAAYLKKDSAKDVLLLMPPPEYVKKHNIQGFISAEPAVFYYFTGLHCAYANMPTAEKATWVLLAEGTNMAFKKVIDKVMLDTLITAYKKYY